MSRPLLSVEMITYNHDAYIAQAIEGVLQQKTSFPFELVIGEDCSTDRTRPIARDYQRRYPDIVRVITSDRNVGMIENGRRTFRACTGEYVAFCEGDDYWHRDDKLQLQVDYLERHPSCALVCSDYDVLYESTGQRTRDWNQKCGLDPSGIRDPKYILRGTPSSGILTCTVVGRRSLLAQAREANADLLERGLQPCADTPLWTHMSRLGEIGYIAESLATYRERVESITHSRSKTKILRTSIAIKEQMLWLVEKYDLPEAERALHVADLWKRKLKLAFYERDPEMAAEAREYLEHLSPREWLQFWGAGNSLVWHFVKMLVDPFERNLIPTVKKK
jgi:hypothetical protein